MKRTLIPVAILAALAVGGIAQAHTPTVTQSCTGITLNFTRYEGPNGNNVATLIVDDATPWYITFGTTYYGNFAWSPASTHHWTLTIDANINTGNKTLYDTAFVGIQRACETPPTTTTVAPTTTTTTVPPTTTTVQPTTTIPGTTPTTSSAPTDPTTTIIAVDEPPLPPTTATIPADVVLPRTGPTQAGATVLYALALVVGGLGGLALARRRK